MLCQSLKQFVLCLLLYRYQREKRIVSRGVDCVDLRSRGSKANFILGVQRCWSQTRFLREIREIGFQPQQLEFAFTLRRAYLLVSSLYQMTAKDG